MGENKEIKVRLSTVVYLVIIVALAIALGVVYYFGFVKDDNANNIIANGEVAEKNNISVNEQENNKLDNQTTVKVDTSKIVNKGEGYTYSTTYGTSNADYVISSNKRNVTIGTDKKINLLKDVKEVCSYILGQGSLDFYVFLYEDGTVGYTDNYGESVKEFDTLKNIIKLMPLDYTREVEGDNGKMVDLGESTVVAIDNEGNIYDLGIMRNNDDEEKVEEKENTKKTSEVPTTDLVAIYCDANNEQAELFFSYIKDGKVYYFHKSDYEGKTTEQYYYKFSINLMGQYQYEEQMKQCEGIDNAKRIKMYNSGTGIKPVIYVITEDGKVYTGSFFEHDFALHLDNRLKEYEVEDILSKTGEMKDEFKLLLKDGTTKTVTVEL